MIKVNNKKTIYHVADISFRADKVRNVFAAIAIILTTILFSGLFIITDSLLASMEESTMRQVGGCSHGGFKFLTMEQYDRLKGHPLIEEISYTVVLANAENTELLKRPTEMRFANDELAAKMHFALPTTGRMPQNPDEIATDTLVLERLGIPAKLGQEVTLDFSVCGEKYTETFQLVGFWEGDIIIPASQAWLDREYVEGVLSQHDLSETDNMIGSVNADLFFSNSMNIEKKLQKVVQDSGYSLGEIQYGVNWAYAGGNNMNFGTVAGIALVVLAIMLCGYLIISNVFLISVAKDVRFYGLLKTIGTTGRQIRTLIRRQAFFLCMGAIPSGCLAGCLIGGFLAPKVLSVLNTEVIKVTFHPWVFAVTVIFAIMTVLVSIRKPSKIAGRVSPVEALRVSDGQMKIKRTKKRNRGISLPMMALGNIGRNKRKTCLVVASLSLGLIILNAAYSMAEGFDMEKYLDRMISHDFVVGDVSNFTVYSAYANQATLSDEFLSGLSESEGLELLARIFFQENQFAMDEKWKSMLGRVKEELQLSNAMIAALDNDVKNGDLLQHIYGLDDALWESLEVKEGSIDVEKLKTGGYVVVGPYIYDEEQKLCAYHVGDKVETFGKDGESKVREVIAVADIPYNISIKHGHPAMQDFFLPSEVFLEEVADKTPMLAVMDVEDSRLEAMEDYLSDYCENVDQNMQYGSRQTYMEEYESTQRTYKTVGMVISALLALIGIANFANTNLTSIMTRRREMALLQSIGMTVRQQKKMLILEGAAYTLFTAVITWTVGVFAGSFALGLLYGDSSYFVARFTVWPSVACVPVLLVITGILPLICQHYVNSRSIVDRLRENE